MSGNLGLAAFGMLVNVVFGWEPGLYLINFFLILISSEKGVSTILKSSPEAFTKFCTWSPASAAKLAMVGS